MNRPVFNKTNIFRAFLLLAFIASVFYMMTVKRADSFHYSYNIEDFNSSDGAVRSPQSSIFADTYMLSVGYESDTDVTYCIQLGSDNEVRGTLSAKSSMGVENIPFNADIDCDHVYFIFYDSSASLKLSQVMLTGTKPLNNDIYVNIIFLFCILLALWILAGSYKKLSAKEKLVLFILLGSMILLNLIPLEDNIRFSGDIRFHLTRINGIKDCIETGQLPAVLFPNSFNGHSEIGALYPNLFLYPVALLRVLGISLLTANKVMVYVINILTVIIAYKCIKTITADKLNAAIAASVYSLFPYRMFVMTASGSAAGRGFALMFLPLFVAGLYRLVRTDLSYRDNKAFYINNILMMTIGAAGIVNSHILCFIMTALFAVAFCIFNIKYVFRRDTLLSLLSGAFLTLFLGLTSISLLLGYIDSGLNIGYLEHDLYIKLDSVSEFMRNPWTIYMTAVLILTVAVFKINKKKLGKGLLVSLILLVVISVLTLNIIPYDYLMQFPLAEKILSTFQNMKRLYFISAILNTYCIMRVLEECKLSRIRKWAAAYIFITLIGCAAMSASEYLRHEPLVDSLVAYTEHEGALEYLPEGSVVDDFRSNSAYISDESALNVIYYDKEGYDATVSYTCSADGVYAELPMFYYRDTKCQDENGEYLPISIGNKNHVRIYFEKTDTPKSMHIFYWVNPVYTLMLAMSLIGYALIFSLLLVSYFRKKALGVI